MVTKTLSINEEGAETVRYIFDRYVAGAGSTMIAKELNQQGSYTIRGNPWCSSSVMGVVNNEKYMGDILLGKSFTVDPISKRRLENRGEEDRFYIKDHHIPIISRETFEKAQEIRARRTSGRKKEVVVGKREKFSRQYAFSCMLKCGFCDTTLCRRAWHSGSKYKKYIWQCDNFVRNGKQYCPKCKGMPEEVIEKAFVESYRMICTDHKDVLEEFLRRVEKTLKEDDSQEMMHRLEKKINNITNKRKNLLDKYLSGMIAQDIYEEAEISYEKELTQNRAKLNYYEKQSEEECNLRRRLNEFRKSLKNNGVLEEFDRAVFESVIEKVIIGGYDKDGNAVPYKITFIYKTGFKDGFDNAKKQFGKRKTAKGAMEKLGTSVDKMCSNVSDKLEALYSESSLNTCGDGCSFVPTKTR